MKVCPFCREEIRDEAIKCRYCSSSLLPSQPAPVVPSERPAPNANQVVYVVDNDLIRFAKFVAGALAIFITIGATLYGFSIKEAADKVGESADKVRDVADKIRDVAETVRTQKAAIDTQANAITATDEQIRKAKDDVDKQVKTLQDTANQINGVAKDVAADRKRVNDLLKQTEQDAAQAHSILANGQSNTNTSPSFVSYSAPQLARLYDFPTELDGKGQTIALIELGGGYRDSDLDAYFARLGVPKPNVTSVSVDGAKNEPGTAGADEQVTVDIEVTGAVAPGAHVVVYFTSNTNQAFLDAVSQAVHDQINHPSVISISWGAAESNWTPDVIRGIDSALRDAALLGLTVVAAAGDGGVTDGLKDGKPHVDFPASSPYALAVGGSRIVAAGGAITSETVWNSNGGATGGGVSEAFPLPEWQKQADVPLRRDGGTGRGLPDVAANASPESGYQVVIAGMAQTVGGTGAATSLWAGLIALINQGIGHNVGYINPKLYGNIGPAGVLHSIVKGDNNLDGVKGFDARSGWNAATGWGSPDGRKLLAAFQ